MFKNIISKMFMKQNYRYNFNFKSLCSSNHFCTHHRHNHKVKDTVDKEEVDKFRKMCNNWWKIDGNFAALHSYNDLRVPLIRDGLLQKDSKPSGLALPLEGKKILDVGCGGGILSEPLCRLGADVLGIDAVNESIHIAELHRDQDDEIKEKLKYQNILVEELLDSEVELFDAVVASEIVEHVADVETFVNACCGLVKPGGSLFLTTLNKTPMSYAAAIITAEYLLHINDIGTHDWNKFVSPELLQTIVKRNGFRVHLLHGTSLNPCSLRWSWTQDMRVTYALHAIRHE